ncbi:hypothetical protein CPIN18021_0340 [Campylobacter pinnipediorum subsp. caledonicus]|uniref:Uncharacterized protein n=1 Tax=Campylobacter pinnipediorum subsp. caledonicus TaxID=1874362 RepID=A0A1S6U613_9BACT|nr:hypothetical protein [Campylobacter pinnipediorum]AQW85580.1 hypothetical protein CPIN18020_0339 [Campylobacter pinnipediorum subsp. caledonicus]AQW87186.1 hypothetical protein CPIN18021_0340 [Campylobacter pinnipediorum subsp. caledonicus]OPA71860.1 hypothetical protein BB381_06915 [Campylobacter pinnipediorum subsp. caledonicus]
MLLESYEKDLLTHEQIQARTDLLFDEFSSKLDDIFANANAEIEHLVSNYEEYIKYKDLQDEIKAQARAFF